MLYIEGRQEEGVKYITELPGPMILRNRPPISKPIPNPPFNLKPKLEGEPDMADVSIDLEVVKEPVEPVEPKGERKVRARNANGEYLGDDPTTPENEAWVILTEADK